MNLYGSEFSLKKVFRLFASKQNVITFAPSFAKAGVDDSQKERNPPLRHGTLDEWFSHRSAKPVTAVRIR